MLSWPANAARLAASEAATQQLHASFSSAASNGGADVSAVGELEVLRKLLLVREGRLIKQLAVAMKVGREGAGALEWLPAPAIVGATGAETYNAQACFGVDTWDISTRQL